MRCYDRFIVAVPGVSFDIAVSVRVSVHISDTVVLGTSGLFPT